MYKLVVVSFHLFLEHCNKRNSDESRTAKILQEKVINMLQTNTRKNHQTSPNRILYQITLIIFLNFSLFNQPLKPSNLGKKATRDYSKFYRQMFLQKLSELTWESSPAVKDPYKLFPLFTKSCISWWTSMRHFQLLSKCEGKQLEKLRITTGIRKRNKNKNELFSPATGKDINSTDMFFFNSSGRLGREKKFIPSGWVTVKKEEQGGVEQWEFF